MCEVKDTPLFDDADIIDNYGDEEEQFNQQIEALSTLPQQEHQDIEVSQLANLRYVDESVLPRGAVIRAHLDVYDETEDTNSPPYRLTSPGYDLCGAEYHRSVYMNMQDTSKSVDVNAGMDLQTLFESRMEVNWRGVDSLYHAWLIVNHGRAPPLFKFREFIKRYPNWKEECMTTMDLSPDDDVEKQVESVSTPPMPTNEIESTMSPPAANSSMLASASIAPPVESVPTCVIVEDEGSDGMRNEGSKEMPPIETEVKIEGNANQPAPQLFKTRIHCKDIITIDGDDDMEDQMVSTLPMSSTTIAATISPTAANVSMLASTPIAPSLSSVTPVKHVPTATEMQIHCKGIIRIDGDDDREDRMGSTLLMSNNVIEDPVSPTVANVSVLASTPIATSLSIVTPMEPTARSEKCVMVEDNVDDSSRTKESSVKSAPVKIETNDTQQPLHLFVTRNTCESVILIDSDDDILD